MTALPYEPIAKRSDKRGLALFEEVVEEIESHEFRTWDQAVWVDRAWDKDEYEDREDMPDFTVEDLREDVQETLVPAFDCGTAACLYGHIAFKAGATLATAWGDDISVSEVVLDGERREVAHLADERLGLPTYLSAYIRHFSRTWPEILAFRDAWREDEAAGPDVIDARMLAIETAYAARVAA